MMKIFLATILLQAGSNAGTLKVPRVLYDTGATRPIMEAYLTPEQQAAREKVCKHDFEPQPFSQNDLYPIKSARLSVGKVGAQKPIAVQSIKKRPGMRPIFLIGDDPVSMKWLKGNASVLNELGALGMVVNVGSRERFEAINRRAGGVTLIAAAGDEIAAELSIFHYPVLITPDGVHQ